MLGGPNVTFTSISQLLSSIPSECLEIGHFSFGVELGASTSFTLTFCKSEGNPVDLHSIHIKSTNRDETHYQGELPLSESPLYRHIVDPQKKIMASLMGELLTDQDARFLTTRDRCFLKGSVISASDYTVPRLFWEIQPPSLGEAISNVLYLPGLRGNPLRNYPLTAVGERFSGPFDNYVASVIAHAERRKDKPFLKELSQDLQALGLTYAVHVQNVDDIQVELRVGRLPSKSEVIMSDLVSIADVGLGVSQALPIVVALLTAKEGQMVIVEQPELHLHPRAQVAMSGLLVKAARRGVRVVVETHSSILLLGIQSLVAQGLMPPSDTCLNWFSRVATSGQTNIDTAELDSSGAFGDWPEDFDDVSLSTQQQYLDAAERNIAKLRMPK